MSIHSPSQLTRSSLHWFKAIHTILSVHEVKFICWREFFFTHLPNDPFLLLRYFCCRFCTKISKNFLIHGDMSEFRINTDVIGVNIFFAGIEKIESCDVSSNGWPSLKREILRGALQFSANLPVQFP